VLRALDLVLPMSMHLRLAISDIFGRVSAAERYRVIFYAETVELSEQSYVSSSSGDIREIHIWLALQIATHPRYMILKYLLKYVVLTFVEFMLSLSSFLSPADHLRHEGSHSMIVHDSLCMHTAMTRSR
jgi:hypothetical protein